MEFDTFAKLLAPAITAIVVFLLKKYFDAKPNLITYMVHASAIPLHDEKNNSVNTHSIVVRNSGKKTAHDVRIGHNYLPPSFQLFPLLNHELIKMEGDAAEILIPTLVPNEQITITYLYFPPITWHQINSYCKSDEMNAKYINVIPTQQPSRPVLALLWILLFIGTSTVVYFSSIRIWNWLN